ncbi:MAG: type II secretion system F family protein, partial [Actinomycetota bacterium]
PGDEMIQAITISCLVGFVIRRRNRRKHSLPNDSLKVDLPELIDQLIVLLRAGYSPANAFMQLEPWLIPPMNGVVKEINDLVRRGVRFSSAVVELRHHLGPPVYALVDALIQLDSDGPTTTAILDRLSDEAHAQRRRRAEAESRELPIRLIFPMVCCVLPSFIMLTVVPMLAGTIAGVRTHLG